MSITPPKQSQKIIGIGAGTSGLIAIKSIIFALPANLNATIFVDLHRSPFGVSYLFELLKKSSRIKIKQAENGEEYKPMYCYVCKPTETMMIKDGRIYVTQTMDDTDHVHKIDQLFTSIAEEAAEDSIGIMLSHNLRDGRFGVEAIKHRGGVTLTLDTDDKKNTKIDIVAPTKLSPQKVVKPKSALGPYISRLVRTEVSRKSSSSGSFDLSS